MFKELSKKLGLNNIQRFELDMPIEEFEDQLEKYSDNDSYYLSMLGFFIFYLMIKTPFCTKKLNSGLFRVRLINRPIPPFYSYCKYEEIEKNKLKIEIETIGISGIPMMLFFGIIFLELIILLLVSLSNFGLFIFFVLGCLLMYLIHLQIYKWLITIQFTQIAKHFRKWESQYQKDLDLDTELI